MTTANASWDTKYEWKAVTLLALGFGLVGLDRWIIAPLFPFMAKDLGLDYNVFQLLTRGLSVDSIRLDRPVIYLRRDGDTWELSRLIKKQETEADRSGPGGLPVVGPSGVVAYPTPMPPVRRDADVLGMAQSCMRDKGYRLEPTGQ